MNAAEVMPGSGTISLRVEPRDREILCAVADTGPGIHPQEQQSIFERYRRGARPGYEGLGLGLTISKGIVEAHGGRIRLESTLGKGATLFFSVPAISDGEPGNASATAPVTSLRTLNGSG